MHRKNPYFRNFDHRSFDLAWMLEKYDYLKGFTVESSEGHFKYDFQKKGALFALTKALLRHDFGIIWSIPDENLCPTLPNRCNYLCWLKWDLLQESESEIRCLDIGVGASCIYPLLGCVMFPKWKFYGTDINKESISVAKENISKNGLHQKITLVQIPNSTIFDHLFDCNDGDDSSKIKLSPDLIFDVSMCNPPFYKSAEEMESLANLKSNSPNCASTGASHEMITEGGEFEFINQMILESLKHPFRVKWYTSMVGKKGTFLAIKEKLCTMKSQVKQVESTVLVQGSTRRWVIAWSFYDLSEMGIRKGTLKRLKSLEDEEAETQNILVGSFATDYSLVEIIEYLEKKLQIVIEQRCLKALEIQLSHLSWTKDCLTRGKSPKIFNCPPFKLKVFIIFSPSLITLNYECDTFAHTLSDLPAIKGYVNSFWNHLRKSFASKEK